jgi:hypothetical protein
MNRVRIKIDPSDLVLEVISIVVAILLALSVNFLAGQVKTHNDVQGALNAISAEMSVNENMIGRLHPTHLKKCGVLQNLARRGRGHKITYTNYQNTLGTVLPFAPPPVQSIAWNLADSSGVASNFDLPSARTSPASTLSKKSSTGSLANSPPTFGRWSSRVTSIFSWSPGTRHSTVRR